MVDQILLGRIAALADALIADGEPAAALVDELELHGKVDHFAPLGDAFAVHDIEICLFEGGRALVLDDLRARAVADDLGAVLDGLGAADVDPDGRVELQRVAAGGRLGVAVHDADLHTQLVDEDDDAVGLGNVAGELPQRLRHEPGL